MIRRRWAIGVAVLAFPVLFATPAAAVTTDDQCAPSGTVTAPDLWAQQMLEPQGAWIFTRGLHQTVAVLDSGVDAGQPQLRGHVEPGYDAVTDGGHADSDCVGSGTQVAGAIVAAKTSSAAIYGMAPDAMIVPVRVFGETGTADPATVPPQALARGIVWATGHRVDVIDVSVAITVDDADVRSAIAGAVAAGITVIASVGDLGTGGGVTTPYPAAYPGVIGVTAIDAAGQVWAGSNYGTFVDLAAPGAGLPALARHRGVVLVDGSTALAAGFVSGAAALVRARWSALSGGQVIDRLLGTASPVGAGVHGTLSGVVNPYRAVTDATAAKPPVRLPGLVPTSPDPAARARDAAERHSRSLAFELAGIGLGALLLVAVIAIGVPRARRRAWHATYAAPLPERLEPDEPVPLAMLFDDLSVT